MNVVAQENVQDSTTIQEKRIGIEAALDYLCTVHDLNRLWLFESNCDVDSEWKKRLCMEIAMCNYAAITEERCVETKCEITACAIRAALTPNYDTSARNGVDIWPCNNNGEDSDTDESLFYQVQVDGGEHWVTFLPHSGAFYHSWYNMFEMRKGRTSPLGGVSMTRKKCVEMFDTIYAENAIEKRVDFTEFIVLWPPRSFSTHKDIDYLSVAKRNVQAWQSSVDQK